MPESNWTPSYMLTLGLSTEDKELIEKAYTNYRPLIERIQTLLSKELSKSVDEMDNISNFSSPNWPMVQAYLSGQRAAYKYLSKLLKNKER